VVRRQFDWNMQYDEDSDLKGDVEIVTTGAVAVMVKEQMSERRMNFLNVTNNPVDLRLTGMEGRANVLREAASALEMSNSEVVKTAEDVRDLVDAEEEQINQSKQQEARAKEQEFQLSLQGLQLDNQLKQMELQVEQEKLAIEKQKLMLENKKLDIAAGKVQSDAFAKKAKADNDSTNTALKAVSEGTKQLTEVSEKGDEIDKATEEVAGEEANV